MVRIFLFAFIICLACKQNEKSNLKENIIKYENGTIKRKYYTNNEVIQDTMWDYYSSGELSKIRLFKDNKQEGVSLYYLKEGPLYEVQHYVKGLLEGGDTVYYPSGKLKLVALFRNGLRNGPFTTYKEDGSIEKVTEYRNDTLITSVPVE